MTYKKWLYFVAVFRKYIFVVDVLFSICLTLSSRSSPIIEATQKKQEANVFEMKIKQEQKYMKKLAQKNE